MDNVEAAFAAVSENAYVLEPDGRPLPQSSNPAIIAAMLRLLDVRPGARVLEIGTGSGFSTALLSQLVGWAGTVVSLDVDPAVAARAARRLSEQGVTNATILAADGTAGHAPAAPFDRIIAWATADALPLAWVEQAATDCLIVAPVLLAPLADSVAVVRARCVAPGHVEGEQVISGSFVPLTPVPTRRWGGPPANGDLVLAPASDEEAASWLSAEWLRGGAQDAGALRDLCLPVTRNQTPFAPGEDPEAFQAYLLARRPAPLTTTFLPKIGRAIGYGSTAGLALISLRDGALVRTGDDDTATPLLLRWLADWRAAGRPGFAQVCPHLERTPEGWTVRATLAPPRAATTLDQLLAGITEQNQHGEIDMGPPVGKEIW